MFQDIWTRENAYIFALSNFAYLSEILLVLADSS